MITIRLISFPLSIIGGITCQTSPSVHNRPLCGIFMCISLCISHTPSFLDSSTRYHTINILTDGRKGASTSWAFLPNRSSISQNHIQSQFFPFWQEMMWPSMSPLSSSIVLPCLSSFVYFLFFLT